MGTVTIEKTARELRKTKSGDDYTSVMFGEKWYKIPGDHRKLYKQTVELEIKGDWAKLISVVPKQDGKPRTAAKWDDIKIMSMAAMNLAHQLLPDLPDGENTTNMFLDRAPARVNFVHLIIEEFTAGRIALPEEPPRR